MPGTTTVNIPASVRAVYSREIIRQAQPKLRFSQFAKKKTELQNAPGGSIKFTKYSNITKGGKLTEGISMDEKAMSNSEIEGALMNGFNTLHIYDAGGFKNSDYFLRFF